MHVWAEKGTSDHNSEAVGSQQKSGLNWGLR